MKSLVCKIDHSFKAVSSFVIDFLLSPGGSWLSCSHNRNGYQVDEKLVQQQPSAACERPFWWNARSGEDDKCVHDNPVSRGGSSGLEKTTGSTTKATTKKKIAKEGEATGSGRGMAHWAHTPDGEAGTLNGRGD